MSIKTIEISEKDIQIEISGRGPQGNPGPAGRGIVRTDLISTVGKVKTYRQVYSDGTYYDYTVEDGADGGDPVWGAITGDILDQTDLQESLDSKANAADLGTMAEADDAPTDNKAYGRKNGEWAEVTGGGGSSAWGQITGTLSDQTDLQEALDGKADIIVNTVSGPIVGIADAIPAPVLGMTISIEPVQSGTGDPSPENIRPITGWEAVKITRYGKNLFDKTQVITGAYLNRSKGLTANNSYGYAYVRVPVGSTVVYSGLKGANGTPCGIQFLNVEKQYIGEPSTEDAQKNGNAVRIPEGTVYIGISVFTGNNANYKDIDTAQLEFGSVPTEYAAYTPTEVTIDLDGTVYGGTVDVKAGTMTVDRAILTFADIVTTPSNAGNGIWVISATDASLPSNSSTDFVDPKIVCNVAPTKSQTYLVAHTTEVGVAHFWTNRIGISTGGEATSLEAFTQWVADNNIQIVYPIATPVMVQLTPVTMDLLTGMNGIWADTGDISVEYKANTKAYIDGQLETLKVQLQALILQH